MSLIKTMMPAQSGQALHYEQIVTEETLHGAGNLPADALNNATPANIAFAPGNGVAPLADSPGVHNAALPALSGNAAVGTAIESGMTPTPAFAKNAAADMGQDMNMAIDNGNRSSVSTAENGALAETSNGASVTDTVTAVTGLNGTNGQDGTDGTPTPGTPDTPGDQGLYISGQVTHDLTHILSGDGSLGSVIDNATGAVGNLLDALTAQTPNGNLAQLDGNLGSLLGNVAGTVNTLLDNVTSSVPLLDQVLQDTDGPLAMLTRQASSLVDGTLDALGTQLPQLAPVLEGTVPLADLSLTGGGAVAHVANMITVNLPADGDGPLAALTLGGQGATGSLVDAGIISPLIAEPLLDITLGQADSAGTPGGVLDLNLLQNGLGEADPTAPALALNLGGQNNAGGLLDVGLLESTGLPLDSIATLGAGGSTPLDATLLGQPVLEPVTATLNPVLEQVAAVVSDNMIADSVMPVVGSVADSIDQLLGGAPADPVASVADGLASTIDSTAHNAITTITNTVASLPILPVIPSLPAVGHGLFHH